MVPKALGMPGSVAIPKEELIHFIELRSIAIGLFRYKAFIYVTFQADPHSFCKFFFKPLKKLSTDA